MTTEHCYMHLLKKSSEIQDCLFPNLGMIINIKPSVMSLRLINDIIKLHVFNTIIYQKYDPKQKLNFQIFRKPIWNFLCVLIYKGPHDNMERKDFDLLQLIVLDIMRILLGFFLFFNVQWNMMTTQLSSKENTENTENTEIQKYRKYKYTEKKEIQKYRKYRK